MGGHLYGKERGKYGSYSGAARKDSPGTGVNTKIANINSELQADREEKERGEKERYKVENFQREVYEM